MHQHLQNHITRFISVSAEELQQILTYFRPMQAAKKELLHKEGQVCRNNYFVVSGCLRMFFINEKGSEQTTHFGLENWWLSDHTSYDGGKPSLNYIQAIEPSALFAIGKQAYDELLHHHPVMERYFRCIHQRAHAAAQFRIRVMFSNSREQMYRDFASRYPDFVQRVPQYILASFLGFTPEYLSEIRKKIQTEHTSKKRS